eukprot:1151437-Pelagomonas_calceolata.AAC.4
MWDYRFVSLQINALLGLGTAEEPSAPGSSGSSNGGSGSDKQKVGVSASAILDWCKWLYRSHKCLPWCLQPTPMLGLLGSAHALFLKTAVYFCAGLVWEPAHALFLGTAVCFCSWLAWEPAFVPPFLQCATSPAPTAGFLLLCRP